GRHRYATAWRHDRHDQPQGGVPSTVQPRPLTSGLAAPGGLGRRDRARQVARTQGSQGRLRGCLADGAAIPPRRKRVDGTVADLRAMGWPWAAERGDEGGYRPAGPNR